MDTDSSQVTNWQLLLLKNVRLRVFGVLLLLMDVYTGDGGMRLLRDRSIESFGARLLNLGMYTYTGCSYNFKIELVQVEQLALTGVFEFLCLPLIHDSGIVRFFVSFTPMAMELLV